MIRKHKQYKRPRKLFDSARISEENILIKKYGLKNKREIWKAAAIVEQIRKQAMALLRANKEIQEAFISRIRKKGLNVSSIADVLALDKEMILQRRLQTLVFKKGLASTPKGARQLITHRKIVIGDRIVNVPSYFVSADEENKIRKK